jgi:hypothetical protein
MKSKMLIKLALICLITAGASLAWLRGMDSARLWTASGSGVTGWVWGSGSGFANDGLAAPRQAQGCNSLVLGDTCVLKEGESLSSSLVIMGGLATLEKGSLVKGDIVIMGGTVRADGEITGNIVAIGGQVALGKEAVVRKDVILLGGNLQREPGAQVEGSVNPGIPGPFTPVIPNVLINQGIRLGFNPFWIGLSILGRSFVWAAITLVVMLFFQKRTETIGQAMVEKPLIAGGLGLLTVVVSPFVLLMFTITIIGIPVALVISFILFVTWCYGVIAVGLEVGRRLVEALKLEWALAVSAALGTFLVTLMDNTVDALIPCVGWLLPAAVGMIGLGAVVLTRFGGQAYPPEFPAAMSPTGTPALEEAATEKDTEG